MPEPTVKPAVLNDEELSQVRELERELGDGVVVVAYAKALEPAKLSPAKLKKLQKLEGELGDVYLLAWRKPRLACE